MEALVKSHKKKLKTSFPKSEKMLLRCVSIPINCKMKNNFPFIVRKSIEKVLKFN